MRLPNIGPYKTAADVFHYLWNIGQKSVDGRVLSLSLYRHDNLLKGVISDNHYDPVESTQAHKVGDRHYLATNIVEGAAVAVKKCITTYTPFGLCAIIESQSQRGLTYTLIGAECFQCLVHNPLALTAEEVIMLNPDNVDQFVKKALGHY